MFYILLKVLLSITRYNYADYIWFYIKQQITKHLSRDIVSIIEIIYRYHISLYRR